MVFQDGVHAAHTSRRQLDQDSSPVHRIVGSLDEPSVLKAVEAVRDSARRDHQCAREVPGRQSVLRARPPQ
jgi:hypothetical protein